MKLRVALIPLAAGLFFAAWPMISAAGADAIPTLPPAKGPAAAIADKSKAAAPKGPLFPKPTPVAPETLPAVFTKSVPASVDDLKAIETRVKELVTRVAPAVVSVRIVQGGAEGWGSAVVISDDGLVLCAAHVGESAGVPVTFTFPDGKTAKGITLGNNHDSDAGLMQITDPGPWPHVQVGDLRQARLGDWVLALGHPGGFDPKRPIVARLGRIIELAGEPYIQTDCTLLGGDSGGPLFDMSGHVIAIHSRISESADENFHVPITAFFDAWDRLASSEDWGVEPGSVPSYIGAGVFPDPEGVRIVSITPGGPAAAAGLQVDDVIRKINRASIRDAASFRLFVANVPFGTKVTLEIKRDGKVLQTPVTIQASPGRGGRGGGGGGGGRGP